MLNFGKNIVVGVSVTPEIGLEVAQVDFLTKTILKYDYRPLEYDNARREITDLDIFKETLLDLFVSMGIPKGSDVVLNIPPAAFNIVDYPASMQDDQVSAAIEEELYSKPIFQDVEPALDFFKLPNSTIQFSKYVYTASQKTALIEIVMQLDELGYNLIAIETSPNATLNALVYNERLNTSPDVTWLMLQVDSTCCRLMSMQGKTYVDGVEERISIGEVLGDEENYSTVVSAIQPLLKNLPSQYMFVVSKTNIISAEALANKLVYSSPIIHQEANVFNREEFLAVDPSANIENPKMISLDVIGAAIKREFQPSIYINLNLFNATLGDVFLSKQPPVVELFGKKIVCTMQNMVVASVIAALVILLPAFGGLTYFKNLIAIQNSQIQNLDADIEKEKRYLKENENVSTELFDEGDEIRMGLVHNKNIYTYFTIVGTEIPMKVWLTSLKLGEHIEIEGQADNLESVYSFFRNIKDYDPSSPIKLQKLGLATKTKMQALTDEGGFDTETLLSSMNADFYEFRISDVAESTRVSAEAAEGDVPPGQQIR